MQYENIREGFVERLRSSGQALGITFLPQGVPHIVPTTYAEAHHGLSLSKAMSEEEAFEPLVPTKSIGLSTETITYTSNARPRSNECLHYPDVVRAELPRPVVTWDGFRYRKVTTANGTHAVVLFGTSPGKNYFRVLGQPRNTSWIGDEGPKYSDLVTAATKARAGGSSEELDGIVQAIVECADTGRTIETVTSFLSYVRKFARKRSSFKNSSPGCSGGQLASGYLWYIFGVAPTIETVRMFWKMVTSELRYCRRAVDNLYETYLIGRTSNTQSVATAATLARKREEFRRLLELQRKILDEYQEKQKREREIALAKYRKEKQLRDQQIAEEKLLRQEFGLQVFADREDVLSALEDKIDSAVSSLSTKYTEISDLKAERALLEAQRGNQEDEIQAILAEIDELRLDSVLHPSKDNHVQAMLLTSKLQDARADVLITRGELQAATRELDRAYADLQRLSRERELLTEGYNDAQVETLDQALDALEAFNQASYNRIPDAPLPVPKLKRLPPLVAATPKVRRTRVYNLDKSRFVSSRVYLTREAGKLPRPGIEPGKKQPFTVEVHCRVDQTTGNVLFDSSVGDQFLDQLAKINSLFYGNVAESTCVYSSFDVRDICESVMNGYGQWIDLVWSLIHPLRIAWALVPMSFVIDWFISVDRAVANFEQYLTGFCQGLKPVDGAWVAARYRPYFGTDFASSYVGRCEITNIVYAGSEDIPNAVVSWTLRYTFTGSWSSSTVELAPGDNVAFERYKLPDSSVYGAFLPPPNINLCMGKVISGLSLLAARSK